MAANTVWAIDVGHNELKAVKAQRAGDRVQILSFDLVEYRQSLVAPGVDRDVQIQQAVHTFVARNDLGGCSVAVVMPAPSALVRFIQLPPVDRSAIADIVEYEARQQIPFPLEEVCWDHAAIDRGFIPGEQVEVGLFALRKEITYAFTNCLKVGGLEPDLLQIPQVALLNFVNFDRHPGREAIMVMDMGVENTHILWLSEDTVWSRSLPIGGHTFTQAIQQALSISYEEAEREKLNARKSPRAREIAEAISQPLSRLIEEVQRSVGYFRSLHPESRIGSMLALGAGFRLPGLARYLTEATGIEIHGLSSLENFDLSAARNVEYFRRHAAGFPVALGAAAQALGILGTLETTMLPPEIIRRKVLVRKKPWAVAAAAAVLAMVGVLYVNAAATNARLRKLEEENLGVAHVKVDEVKGYQTDYSGVSVAGELAALRTIQSVFQDRGVWFKLFDELTAPIPKEPDNETIWLIGLRATYVSVQEAARGLVDLPPELSGLTVESMGGRGRGFGDADTGLMNILQVLEERRSGREFGRPGGQPESMGGEMPEVVQTVVVWGEVRHDDRQLYIKGEFVDKLDASPLFSFPRLVFAAPVYRWVDSAGRVVDAAVFEQVARDRRLGAGPLETVEVPGFQEVEYTQFVVKTFIDSGGKLAEAVRQEQEVMDELVKLYRQTVGG